MEYCEICGFVHEVEEDVTLCALEDLRQPERSILAVSLERFVDES